MKTIFVRYLDDSWSAAYGKFFTDHLVKIYCECGFESKSYIEKYGVPVEARIELLEHQMKHLTETPQAPSEAKPTPSKPS